MSKKLVIVESPHKSKTIEKYLGKMKNGTNLTKAEHEVARNIINSFPLCDTMFLDNLTKFDHKLFSCIVIVLLHSFNFSAKYDYHRLTG